MQVLIDSEAINTIIEWCGVDVLPQLFHVEEFYPDATQVIISLGTKVEAGDPTIIRYEIATDADTKTFSSQRHAHGHWLREANHELYMHMAIQRMPKGPHDHTPSIDVGEKTQPPEPSNKTDPMTCCACNEVLYKEDGNAYEWYIRVSSQYDFRDKTSSGHESLTCEDCIIKQRMEWE